MLTQAPAPDPKCELNITSFINTSTSITLPYLCQSYHGHCIVTSSDGGMLRLIGPLQDRLWSTAGFCVGGTGRCRKICGRWRNEDALRYTTGIMVAAGYLWSLLEIYGLCRKIMAVAGIRLNCLKM